MINRRKFIQQTAAGVAALTIGPAAFAKFSQNAKTGKLGVALMGLGYYSTDLLAPALQMTQHCYLAGIITGTPSKAEKWKKQYNIPDKNIYNYQNLESIANNPDIDIVYVVLPPSMHAEYVIRSAKAGKHVWCEKPMAISEKECQSMIDACNSNKRKLSIGYRLHHEPNTRKVMQLRKDLVYGKVISVQATAGYVEGRTNHWKQIKKMGGGVMPDMGVYPLNAIRYATGLEPIAVTAQASTTRPEIYKEVEETMKFQLEFPGGVTANGEATFGANVNELSANYSKGWIKLSPFSAYAGIKGTTSDGLTLNAVIPSEQAAQMDDDALAIKNNTNVMVPGEEGLRDIRVVEAIYRSVAQKGKVSIG